VVSALGKILILDNLRKWNVLVMDRCCMCKRNEKSVDHLLIHCDVACAIWITFFTFFIFGLTWVMPKC
jgi:hypothetical protein